MAIERTCRICGCTQCTPCPGGCAWVEEDLCSACLTDARREAAVAERLVRHGMPPELAPTAVRSWMCLLDASEELLTKLEASEDLYATALYFFMQGFMAGAVKSAVPEPEERKIILPGEY